MRHYGIVRLQLLKACVILLFKFNHHATATSSFCNFATIWAPTANAKRLSDYVPIYYSYCCCHLLSERFATFYYYCCWHLLAELFAIFITLTTAPVHGISCPSDLTLYCLVLLLLMLSQDNCVTSYLPLYTTIATAAAAAHHGTSCPSDLTLYCQCLLLLLLLLLSQDTYVRSYFPLYILLLPLLFIMAPPAQVI